MQNISYWFIDLCLEDTEIDPIVNIILFELFFTFEVRLLGDIPKLHEKSTRTGIS